MFGFFCNLISMCTSVLVCGNNRKTWLFHSCLSVILTHWDNGAFTSAAIMPMFWWSITAECDEGAVLVSSFQFQLLLSTHFSCVLFSSITQPLCQVHLSFSCYHKQLISQSHGRNHGHLEMQAWLERVSECRRKGGWSDVKMVVGSVRSILQTSDTTVILATSWRGFAETSPKRRKYPVSSLRENASVMSGVRRDHVKLVRNHSGSSRSITFSLEALYVHWLNQCQDVCNKKPSW